MTELPPMPDEDIPPASDPPPIETPFPEIDPGDPAPEIGPIDTPGPEIPNTPPEELPQV